MRRREQARCRWSVGQYCRRINRHIRTRVYKMRALPDLYGITHTVTGKVGNDNFQWRYYGNMAYTYYHILYIYIVSIAVIRGTAVDGRLLLIFCLFIYT